MPQVKKTKIHDADDSTSSTNVVSGQLQKRLTKSKSEKPETGVVFIKHLPHGFFEEQLKKYFKQFGEVTRLRLLRSKKTGGSKGLAYVEFEFPEVAQVAAETMNNYLMFNRVVQAQYIPPNKQEYNYFKTSLRKVKNKAGKNIYISGKTAASLQKMKIHNNWTSNTYQNRTESKLKKIDHLNEKYAHLGIDFNKIMTEPKTSENNSNDEQPSTSKQVLVETDDALDHSYVDKNKFKKKSNKFANKGSLNGVTKEIKKRKHEKVLSKAAIKSVFKELNVPNKKQSLKQK